MGLMGEQEKLARQYGSTCSFLSAPQSPNHQAVNTFASALLSPPVPWCCTVPDVIGELFLIAVSVAQLPVKKPGEDQEDDDEQQRAHNGANYHRRSVWSCKYE